MSKIDVTIRHACGELRVFTSTVSRCVDYVCSKCGRETYFVVVVEPDAEDPIAWPSLQDIRAFDAQALTSILANMERLAAERGLSDEELALACEALSLMGKAVPS